MASALHDAGNNLVVKLLVRDTFQSRRGTWIERGGEARVIEKKLRWAAAEGAFLVVAAPPCRMLTAQGALLHPRFDLERRNVDELLIRTATATSTELRSLAGPAGTICGKPRL